MDLRGGDDDLVKKSSSSNNRLIREHLMKERTKALELLQATSEHTAQPNKSTNKSASSSQATTKKTSLKLSSSANGEKSPKNKENICCENNKKCLDRNWTSSHGPKQSTLSLINPKRTVIAKSPANHNQHLDTSQRSFQDTHRSSQTDNQARLSVDEYVTPRHRKPIDLSALMRSDSISLNSSTLPTRKDTDVSFHPAEMGGRSTLHIYDSKPKQITKLSVDEILASSFVADVRNSLCGSRLSAASSSCITDFSAMQKNPRPTTPFDEILNENSIFSCFDANASNIGNFVEEEFAPAEMMQSQLLNDEISWAKERAAVPTIVLSNEARKKLKSSATILDRSNESVSFNPFLQNDPNFSVGRFFAMRSNDINDIVQRHSPPKDREPIALLSDDTIITSSERSTYSYDPVTPVIDNNRYSHVEELGTETLMPTKLTATKVRSHDSKDSGNASGKWDLLSLSAIEKILASNESGSKAAMEIMSKVNKSNEANNEVNEIFSSIMAQKAGETDLVSTDVVDLVKRAEQISNIANVILENKENIQSHGRCSDSMADTLSFTESLLNTSIQNYRMSNAGHARVPLSPIPILVTESENIENDGDIDEITHSPVISPGRRKRYSKSPRNSSCACAIAANEDVGVEKSKLSPNSVKSPMTQTKIVTPVKSKSPLTVNSKKSLCSTRLDSDRSSPAGSSGTLTPTHNAGHSVFELSPLSSCQSEAGIAVRKKGNSISNWQCGAPMSTYSSNSIKSSDSTSTRSTSRCSNNSEFSHRDGKMPIKATELELSWPSVKLRTDSHKSTKVKNISDKRLVVRIETFGPGFKLINPDSNNLTLLPEECRTIIVNFSPTMIGPAIGRLVFQPPRKYGSSSCLHKNNNTNNATSEVTIPLYAYGGHASIVIQNLIRGPSGEPFVPMGEFCTLIRPLERSIEIYNKGPLMGFAAVFIEPTRLNIPEISNSILIEPECALIEPRSAVSFRLAFQPNHSDLKNIRKFIDKVMTLAKLRIMYGDEAIRQRIRQMQCLMSSEARKKVFGRSLERLWTQFPGEQKMFPPGIFKDSVSVAQDLWTSIFEQDVALTLNNNMLDETAAEISTIFTEGDNSILFRTMRISSPSGQLETVEE